MVSSWGSPLVVLVLGLLTSSPAFLSRFSRVGGTKRGNQQRKAGKLGRSHIILRCIYSSLLLILNNLGPKSIQLPLLSSLKHRQKTRSDQRNPVLPDRETRSRCVSKSTCISPSLEINYTAVVTPALEKSKALFCLVSFTLGVPS